MCRVEPVPARQRSIERVNMLASNDDLWGQCKVRLARVHTLRSGKGSCEVVSFIAVSNDTSPVSMLDERQVVVVVVAAFDGELSAGGSVLLVESQCEYAKQQEHDAGHGGQLASGRSAVPAAEPFMGWWSGASSSLVGGRGRSRTSSGTPPGRRWHGEPGTGNEAAARCWHSCERNMSSVNGGPGRARNS